MHAEQLRTQQLLANMEEGDKPSFSVGDYIIVKGGITVLVNAIGKGSIPNLRYFAHGTRMDGSAWVFASTVYKRHLTIDETVVMKLRGIIFHNETEKENHSS